MIVLDASAILNAMNLSMQKHFCTVPEVLDELKDPRARNFAELLKAYSPSEDSVGVVNEAAKNSGDIETLSDADVNVLALALEKDAELWTDDYAMQNVAKFLNIKYKPLIFKGIRKKIKWKKKCPNCGKIYSFDEKECEFCDEELFRTR